MDYLEEYAKDLGFETRVKKTNEPIQMRLSQIFELLGYDGIGTDLFKYLEIEIPNDKKKGQTAPTLYKILPALLCYCIDLEEFKGEIKKCHDGTYQKINKKWKIEANLRYAKTTQRAIYSIKTSKIIKTVQQVKYEKYYYPLKAGMKFKLFKQQWKNLIVNRIKKNIEEGIDMISFDCDVARFLRASHPDTILEHDVNNENYSKSIREYESRTSNNTTNNSYMHPKRDQTYYLKDNKVYVYTDKVNNKILQEKAKKLIDIGLQSNLAHVFKEISMDTDEETLEQIKRILAIEKLNEDVKTAQAKRQREEQVFHNKYIAKDIVFQEISQMLVIFKSELRRLSHEIARRIPGDEKMKNHMKSTITSYINDSLNKLSEVKIVIDDRVKEERTEKDSVKAKRMA